jgi:hypothetical protein
MSSCCSDAILSHAVQSTNWVVACVVEAGPFPGTAVCD